MKKTNLGQQKHTRNKFISDESRYYKTLKQDNDVMNDIDPEVILRSDIEQIIRSIFIALYENYVNDNELAEVIKKIAFSNFTNFYDVFVDKAVVPEFVKRVGDFK